MTDDSCAGDRLERMLEAYAASELDEAGITDLAVAIHQAIWSMCHSLLGGNAEAAYDAEQETWRRLLEHLRRRNPQGGPILNGTAYVRHIARHVCDDLTNLDREMASRAVLDDLGEDDLPAGEPAWAQATGADLFEYRSPELLADLGGLSAQERGVLALRQQGRSYPEIADRLGNGLTPATAQRQGERAMHHLRGRVQVRVWTQQPVAAWSRPPCPRLAQLKAAVGQTLAAGATPNTTLYRDIGRHLDPRPNRNDGDPACQTCQAER